MTTVTLEIPEKFNNIISFDTKRKNIDLETLLSMLGIDIEFLISERKYQEEYLQNLKDGDFIVPNKF